MARKTTVLLPALKRLLKALGENIKLACLRKQLSAQLVAERAGMSRTTLRAIENGEAGVTIGAYANVLMCMGLESDLAVIARDDELGHKLQDAGLLTKARAPKKHRDEKERSINQAHPPCFSSATTAPFPTNSQARRAAKGQGP